MPNYDIYVLTNLRNKKAIEKFIDHFTERTVIDDLKDEELMVLPIGAPNEDDIELNGYDWIPAIDLDNVLKIGLSTPIRAFRFYIPSSKDSSSTISISFTSDNRIIFGVSIEIIHEQESFEKAEEILNYIFREYQGINGGIYIEEPPCLDSNRFIHKLKNVEKHCLKVI